MISVISHFGGTQSTVSAMLLSFPLFAFCLAFKHSMKLGMSLTLALMASGCSVLSAGSFERESIALHPLKLSIPANVERPSAPTRCVVSISILHAAMIELGVASSDQLYTVASLHFEFMACRRRPDRKKVKFEYHELVT